MAQLRNVGRHYVGPNHDRTTPDEALFIEVPEGAIVEVGEKTQEYLLATFPGLWEPVDSVPVEEATDGAEATPEAESEAAAEQPTGKRRR